MALQLRFLIYALTPHDSVHINNLMIRKHHQMSLRSTNVAMEDLPFQPLPTLFRLLGLTPFKKVPTCDLGLLLGLNILLVSITQLLLLV